MALTDQQMQIIQKERKENISMDVGDVIDTEGLGFYQIIHKQNDSTQALAIVSVDDKLGHNPNYQETAIVVLGTQVGVEKLTPSAISYTPNESTTNAIIARQGMTPQYQEISKFYEDTFEKISKYDGEVSNMSGYSQSGPAVAKVAATNKVEKITNFMDWGGQSAVKNGDITTKEKAYLDKHATIYSDSGKELTRIDGGKGAIPYGKVVVTEATPGIN